MDDCPFIRTTSGVVANIENIMVAYVPASDPQPTVDFQNCLLQTGHSLIQASSRLYGDHFVKVATGHWPEVVMQKFGFRRVRWHILALWGVCGEAYAYSDVSPPSLGTQAISTEGLLCARYGNSSPCDG